MNREISKLPGAAWTSHSPSKTTSEKRVTGTKASLRSRFTGLT